MSHHNRIRPAAKVGVVGEEEEQEQDVARAAVAGVWPVVVAGVDIPGSPRHRNKEDKEEAMRGQCLEEEEEEAAVVLQMA